MERIDKGPSWGEQLAIGLAAGLAGTALMNGYWAVLKHVSPPSKEEEATTAKVAAAALKQVGVPHPSKQVRQIGGQVVHWGYGGTWGMISGAARRLHAPLDLGGGPLLGIGLWALGDLWMLHKLGFSRHPRRYPVSVHVKALGAHLVYGAGVWATLAAARRLRAQPEAEIVSRLAA